MMKKLFLASMFSLSLASLLSVPAFSDHKPGHKCSCEKDCAHHKGHKGKDGKCEKCACKGKECAKGESCTHESGREEKSAESQKK